MATATRASVGRSVVAVATILAMVLAVAVAVRAGVDGDGAAATELDELLAAGRSHTGVATYDARLTTLPGALVTLQVFRAAPDVRYDLAIDTAGTVTRVAAISTPQGHRRCVFETGGGWACAPASPGSSEPEALLAAFRTAVATGAVEVADARVAGREARCFTARPGASTGELCLDADGLILRASTADAEIELVGVDDDVAPEVFEDPASVGG